MSSTDSSETSAADLAKGREQTKAEIQIPASKMRIGPSRRTDSSGRRLDVDAVLERSVRKVENE